MRRGVVIAIGILLASVVAILAIISLGRSDSARRRSEERHMGNPQSANSEANQIQEVQQTDANSNLATNRYARRPGTLDSTIDFWGKVIDENGDPIPNAQVVVSIRSWGNNLVAYFLGARFREETLVTDKNGLLALTNRIGNSLVIRSITKLGYSLAQQQQLGFSYGSPSDSPPCVDEPRQLVMISEKSLATPGLKEFKYLTRIGCDNGVIGFDLERGTKVSNQANGDLIVHFNRRPTNISNADKYDWELRIEVPNGGITNVQESDRGFFGVGLGLMSKATENGYSPMYEVIMDQDGPDWEASKTWTFYFKTGAKFGKAVLQVNSTSIQETTPLSLRGLINVTGSTFLGGE